ncbi:O-acetyl-ADP-ribose deacetylase MACROD2 [Trichinella nelsoni]|uniref:O-acetyl-ADP-ribose deacetylase MACROD2 n=1 Tax=Trichinella nelsoni TaxID=6336 RepID=A0A0V0SEL6_9BILA|nr:O-acetyl-ADP-ribose deacetylase MACROD2 [Trichinella nelsoni]
MCLPLDQKVTVAEGEFIVPRISNLKLRIISNFQLEAVKISKYISFVRKMAHYSAVSEQFLNMPLAEKRKFYACGNNFVTLENIPTVDKMFHCDRNVEMAKKFSLWQGDITSLEINAIVNAANSALRVGGGVDGAIHRAAGKELSKETATLGGCAPGFAKITHGYRLPAKYVIHTVGPTDGNPETLKSCYKNCFDICSKKALKSIVMKIDVSYKLCVNLKIFKAFPCVGTGIYGFPNDKACEIAVTTALEWLKTTENMETMNRIIFCVFLDLDKNLYMEKLKEIFTS